MKKVMMTKYGFIRWPEQDFTDDGSKFDAYRVGARVRVTKCVYNGQAYIDADIPNAFKLPYEVYSKLPHYKALSKLNGIAVDSLTDGELIDLYEACIAYEKEYTEAEDTIVMPTIEEIANQCKRIRIKAAQELTEINKRFSLTICDKLSKWEWTNVREYMLAIAERANKFDPAVYPQKIYGTAISINFCKPDSSELNDTWYYTKLLEYMNR